MNQIELILRYGLTICEHRSVNLMSHGKDRHIRAHHNDEEIKVRSLRFKKMSDFN